MDRRAGARHDSQDRSARPRRRQRQPRRPRGARRKRSDQCRTLPHPQQTWRRRHGRGLPRRARRRLVEPAGGVEAAPGDVAALGPRRPHGARTGDPGEPQSPEHCAAVRRRPDRDGTAVPGARVRRRTADRRIRQLDAPDDSRPAACLPAGRARRRARARSTGGPPRLEAVEHPGHERRRREVAGLRYRQADRRTRQRRQQHHRFRRMSSHPRLRVARAAGGQDPWRRHRRLLARRPALRAPRRAAAVPARGRDRVARSKRPFCGSTRGVRATSRSVP